MNLKLVGNTRTSVRRDHAMIAPDSHVRSPLPGWDGTEGVVLISPHMGARFTQYLAYLKDGSPPALARIPNRKVRILARLRNMDNLGASLELLLTLMLSLCAVEVKFPSFLPQPFN